MKRHLTFRSIPFALLALALVLFTGACESEEPNTGTTIEDVTDPDVEGVDDGILGAQELYEGYNPYVGQTVTISGEIAEVYGPNAVLIGEDLWGENLLVIIPEDATVTGTTAAGDAVTVFDDLDVEYVLQVTGTVQQYLEAEFDTDYDWDLDPELETEVEDQEPMIIAERVEVMTEEGAEAME